MRSPPALKGTAFSEAEKESAAKNNRLLFISLMTSPMCNLRCPDCYVGAQSAARGCISLEKRKQVIDEAKNLGAFTLRIAGEGEPMLDEHFWDLVEYTKSIGMDMFFFTNGTLIDEDMARRIASYEHLTPVVKFSGSPEFMERFTGGRGFFRKERFVEFDGLLVPKGLKNLIDVGLNAIDEEGNSRLGIEYLLRKANYGYAFDIFRWARRNSIIPYFEQNLEAGCALGWDAYLQERVRDSDAYNLSAELKRIDETEFGFTWIPSVPYLVGGICESEKCGCKKYTYNLVISSLGDAYPCYAAHFNLGNVNSNTLRQIVENPVRLKLLSDAKYNCLCRVYSRTLNSGRGVASADDLCLEFDYKSVY